jgi:hypothetical protein
MVGKAMINNELVGARKPAPKADRAETTLRIDPINPHDSLVPGQESALEPDALTIVVELATEQLENLTEQGEN